MEPNSFYNNSIFWVELDRISPNPYQPRKEFNDDRLSELAESIRQYGILQPLVVTRHEKMEEEGGLSVSYELIAGERRLRASKIAGLSQVPVFIRSGEDTGKVKLELAIIENLQREDLNPIDRADAFSRLAKEFGYKHTEIAKKIGKSREYVANTIRLLGVPDEMQEALRMGKITEGHTRPLLMLADRKDEQNTLFKEILYKKLTVRETESIARRIALDKVRKKKGLNPEIIELERKLTETLGTRVQIEEKNVGGKIVIDYFSADDLRSLLLLFHGKENEKTESFLNRFIASTGIGGEARLNKPSSEQEKTETFVQSAGTEEAVDDRPKEERDDDNNLYSIKNFSI